MASPFRHFRKYTGLFMVVLTALLMMTFVVAEPLMQMLGAAGGGGGGPRRGSGEVAVSWDGGRLTEGDLDELVDRRQLLKAFHDTVIGLGNQVALADGTADLQLSVARLQLPASTQERVEQDVVNTKILVDAARDSGMTVSDKEVEKYIRALGRGKVDNESLRQILKRMEQGGRRRLRFEYVFELFREAILARNFRQSYAYTFATVMPQQRYRDWLAVNDRVVVEAAAFNAEGFLAEVPEPTDAELKAFFDEHKDRQSLPEYVGRVELPSPTPGFAAPRRVTLQYLRADYQAALDAAKEEVTDEEIAAYYEENKAQFIKADDLLSGDSLGEDLFDDEDTDDEGADDEDSDSEDSAGAEEEASADDDGEATASEEPAPEEPASEETGEGNQSSNARSASPFRFVVLQDEEDAAADDESDSVPEATEADDKPADEDEAADGGEEGEKKVEYQPLEEVSDTIRQRLAEERAAKNLRDLMDEIQADLRKQYRRYLTEVVVETPEGETPEPPPESLSNLEPYAEKHNLELTKVERIAGLAFRDTALGKTFGASGATAYQPLLGVLFAGDGSEIDNYEPIVTFSDSTFDRYLVQRLEDLEPSVPELDDVRDEVVAAWKRVKAAELALAAAEEQAEAARASGEPLADFFSGNKAIEVVETAPFSRMSVGLMNQRTRQTPLQISQPSEIAAAGPAFMEAVFDNEGVSAVQNHDHSVAYVVRIARHAESPAELRRGYLGEGGFWFGQQAMDGAHAQEVGKAFFDDVVGESGLDWRRAPDEPR